MIRNKYKILSFKAVGTVIPHSLTDIQTTLSAMGHRVFVLDIPAVSDDKLKEIAIMDALVDIKPDIVFTIDSVGLIPHQYLTLSPAMKVISWFFDDPVPFIRDMDVSLFNSRYYLFSWDRAYESVTKKIGVKRFHYMPFATNPEIYHPISCDKKYDVSFVGTWSDKREKVILAIAQRGVQIDVFGDKKWHQLQHSNIRFHGFADNREQCPLIYNQSKINLNISNEQLLTSLPLRIFDVGACKAFLLTDAQEDAKKIFSAEELVIYKDIDDLIVKISYYLNNDSLRESISHRMFEKVNTGFTYQGQLEKILAIVMSDTLDFPDRQSEGRELITILWKKALSLMYFAKFDEAVSHLSFAATVKTSDKQIRIVSTLSLAVCLKLAGNEQAAYQLINSNEILKAPYERLINLQNHGEFRTALYYLKGVSFDSTGAVPHGTAQRVRASKGLEEMFTVSKDYHKGA